VLKCDRRNPESKVMRMISGVTLIR